MDAHATTRTGRRAELIAWCMAAAYAAALCALSLVKSRFYLYQDFDYAIFAQATNGILHGTLFDSIRGMNWLGDHSSLTLFLIAPLYALFHHPVLLLVLQSVVLGLGVIPVHRLARAQLGSDEAGIAFAAVYLLYPALAFSNLYEFHPETLSTTFLLFTFVELLEGRLLRMAVFAVLALLGREDVALVIAGMGIYAIVASRPRAGAWLLGLAAASLFLSFGILKPRFNGGEGDFGLLYSHWGATPGALAKGALSHPLEVLRALVSTPGDAVDSALKRGYYGQLLLPVAFLALLSPSTLWIALPIVLEHMLADGHERHTIVYHYTALITPVILVSAVMGARRLRARVPLRLILGGAVLASLVANLGFGAFSPRPRAPEAAGEPAWPTPMDRTLAPYRDRMVAQAASTGGVVASFAFLDRFANRANVHSAHHVLCGHYTISLRPYPMPRGIDALVADFDPASTLASVDLGTGQRLRDLLSANRLRVLDTAGSLMRCGHTGVGDSLELWSVADSTAITNSRPLLYDGRLAMLGGGTVGEPATPGGALSVRTYWRREGEVKRVYALAYVLLDLKGRVVAQSTTFLGSLVNPVHLWPEATTMRVTDRIVVPQDIAPGGYQIALRVASWDGRALALATADDARVDPGRGMTRIGTVLIVRR